MHRRFVFPILLLLACGDPPVDDGDGGTAPEPTGVISGTVLYSGPRPVCAPNEDGVVVPVGRVVLTLFESDNPPAPEGSATGALNLLTVPGPQLFTSLDDCLPNEPTLEDRRLFITRSVEFTWPEIPLGEDGPIDYQVRGYYDYDSDFNPFFSVSNLPTAGDVVGGAFLDPSAEVLTFQRIRFGSRDDSPLGEVRGGVSVALAAPVNTERPVFRLENARPLVSEATIPLVPDAVMQEEMLWQATETRLTLYSRDPADPQTAALLQAMNAGGLSLDTANPFAYSWVIRSLDTNRDGSPDPHPILGLLGIPWQTPAPLMRRVASRQDVEAAARIPTVLLFPSVRPSQVDAQGVFYPSIDVLVPPVAVMRTNVDARCTFPMIPPGNIAPFYEAQTSDCQEVPAALYATAVFHGVAAAIPVGGGLQRCPDDPGVCTAPTTCVDGACVVVPPVSVTGTNLLGGIFPGQGWTLPNELGDAAQVGADNAIAEQGNDALFAVVDPDPSTPTTARPGCDTALDPVMMAPRPIAYTNFAEFGDDADEVRTLCCGPIQHLCGVPLCEASDLGGGAMIRNSPTMLSEEDGITPNCVPFLMPAACCGAPL
ncbi:MAG: hypothetical protein AAGE52_01895 [Myxococcota bacterium]